MKDSLQNILFFAMIFAMICAFIGYVFLLVWLVGKKDDSIIYPIIAFLGFTVPLTYAISKSILNNDRY